MVDKYFDVIINEFNKYRLFREEVDEQELLWHQDEKDRKVLVLAGKNWEFQFDDELPFRLEEGIVVRIPNHKYHRVIKGVGDLIIKITEN